MPTKLPDWLIKSAAWLQSGAGEPLSPPVPEINAEDFGAAFSRYGAKSPLDAAINAGNRSPSAPAILDAGQMPTEIPRTEIPRADMLPINQGSWFNRTKDTAYSQATRAKVDAQETAQVKEQMAIQTLIDNNPDIFVGRPAESFVNIKQAEAYLKEEKGRAIAKDKLGETKRHNQSTEANAAKKKKGSRFAPNGAAPVSPAPAYKTAEDIVKKFNF